MHVSITLLHSGVGQQVFTLVIGGYRGWVCQEHPRNGEGYHVSAGGWSTMENIST